MLNRPDIMRVLPCSTSVPRLTSSPTLCSQGRQFQLSPAKFSESCDPLMMSALDEARGKAGLHLSSQPGAVENERSTELRLGLLPVSLEEVTPPQGTSVE